jgi:hypothetical protein
MPALQDITNPLKCCTQCGSEKPRTREYFDTSRQSRDGLKQPCKVCRRAEYHANPEAARQRTQAWYRENTARAKAYLKAYRDGEKREELLGKKRADWTQHKEEINHKRREDRQKDHTRILAREQQWRKNHRDKGRLYSRTAYAKRYERLRGLPNTFTEEQWKSCLQYWGYACAVCGKQEGFQWTLAQDHWIALDLSNSLGHVVDNIVPLCHGIDGCNNSKRNHVAEEWLVRKLGNQRAARVLKRIQDYFQLVTQSQEGT